MDPSTGVERGAALDAVFKPVQPPTTFEETVERLGTAIRLGLLPSGSRLPQSATWPASCTSRARPCGRHSPRWCRAATWCRCGGAGGTFVAKEPPLGQEGHGEPLGNDARALLDYRVAIETGATLLAAERATEADLAPLVELTERMDETSQGPFEDYRRADVRFT